jgi:hypothetical protein
MEKIRPGVIQYVSSRLIIISEGHRLYLSEDSGNSWKLWCRLPIRLSDRCLSIHRWLARAFRKEVNHVIKVSDDIFACYGFDQIYLIERATGSHEHIGSIEGSRPLKVASDGERLIYGVYSINNERRPVKLLSYCLTEKKWSIDYVFDDIRHIHGVFWDPVISKLWITTGDLDQESRIITFSKAKELEEIASGSQQFRAVDLLFSEDYVYFATDTPEEINFIYRMHRKTRETERLCEVGGPVFWGRSDGDWLFFSTVVEASEVNREDAVELWASNDEGDHWTKLKEFKKDMFHSLYFQYGQIKFPDGPGDDQNLWFSPYSTELDHSVMRLQLDSDLRNKLQN